MGVIPTDYTQHMKKVPHLTPFTHRKEFCLLVPAILQVILHVCKSIVAGCMYRVMRLDHTVTSNTCQVTVGVC